MLWGPVRWQEHRGPLHPPAHLLLGHPVPSQGSLFPGATDNLREPGWVPLSLASVSSFGKGGRLEKLWRPICLLCPKDLVRLWGLPSTQPPGSPARSCAACLGRVPEPRGRPSAGGSGGAGAAAAGKVTPLSSPVAGGRAAGGTALLPPRGTCPAHPLLHWGRGLPGQWDRAVGVPWWEGSFIGFVRISLPQLACSQTHPAPGKRALLTSPGPALRTSGCPPRKRGHSETLVSPPRPPAPAHPGALGSARSLGGGRAQPPPPMASWAGFPSTRPGQRSWGRLPGHRASTLTTRPGTRLGLAERCF